MTLIILKELLEAIIFNKGWKLVLVAFFIAFLDSCAWVYTEDTNNTRFDLIVIVIGLSYILYTEADRMRLSRQEFQWVILRFCDKKPHQAKWYFNGEFYDKFAQADKLSVDYITNIIQRSQPISSYKSHKSSICRPLDYDVSNVLDSTQLGLVIDNEMQGSKQLNEINLELALDNKTSENQESQFIHSYSKFVSNKFIEEAEKNNESKKSKQFDKTNF
ncbi:10487_t:CDS:2, partial [Rhizophagus irregularis]